MEDSIFTKIIKGQIPCYKVYEDERTFAFLDIYPIQPGHTLVVPKKQVVNIWDLDDMTYEAVMATTRKVARCLRQIFPDKTHIGVHIEGLDVAHAHVKVFPFSNDSEFHFHPDTTQEPDHHMLAEIANKMISWKI